MNAWFKKNLGDAMLASEALDQVKALFLAEYGKANYPRDMAAFVRHESEGHLHCELKVYFSPAALAVAKALDADPCARPSPDGLSLLAGAEDAWSSLFTQRAG